MKEGALITIANNYESIQKREKNNKVQRKEKVQRDERRDTNCRH